MARFVTDLTPVCLPFSIVNYAAMLHRRRSHSTRLTKLLRCIIILYFSGDNFSTRIDGCFTIQYPIGEIYITESLHVVDRPNGGRTR